MIFLRRKQLLNTWVAWQMAISNGDTQKVSISNIHIHSRCNFEFVISGFHVAGRVKHNYNTFHLSFQGSFQFR